MKTRTVIGDYTYGAPLIYGKAGHCFIGKFCSIGDNVRIDIGHEHNPDNISTYPFNVLMPDIAGHLTTHPKFRGDVRIGNDVWIGFDTIILSGVTIGDGAVIGANSVVKHDVSPYTVSAGSPATFKRRRFELSAIAHLMDMKWWDWPDERLFTKEVIEMLMGSEVRKLYDYWRGWQR
jgi:acetyltransferase-like isoleucine patch superfamily enzyme